MNTRSWKMGFFYTPPRQTVFDVLHTIDLFSTRSELAAIHEELPWTDLLNGVAPDTILQTDKDGLVNYLRGKGLGLFFMADLTDGLSRKDEAPQLRTLGRSITEPEVRQVYRDYVLAFVRRYGPDYIGLAAETNLIRQAAGTAVYDAVVQGANDAAADLQAAGETAPFLISIQVETAWGALAGAGSYAGIEQDFADFPFMEKLGLSSYPYFGFTQPENIPENYYGRLLNGRPLPVMVCEGGWASANAGSYVSSPEKQARYISRHADLLDSVEAEAVIQTLFADIDIAQLAAPVPQNLLYFVFLGLVDKDFHEKSARSLWDGLFARLKI